MIVASIPLGDACPINLRGLPLGVMWRVYIPERPGFASRGLHSTGTPGWVLQAAVVTAAAVVIVPLLLLLAAAVLAGLVVLVTFGAIARLLMVVRVMWFRLTAWSGGQGWPQGGRRNVRVVNRR